MIKDFKVHITVENEEKDKAANIKVSYKKGHYGVEVDFSDGDNEEREEDIYLFFAKIITEKLTEEC